MADAGGSPADSFIHVRCGQCFCELATEKEAANWLPATYLIEAWQLKKGRASTRHATSDLSTSLGHGMLKGMASLDNQTKPKRSWLQFSIRAMLVVVSVSCVVLAIWVAPVERQRRAVAAIEAVGGRVTYMEHKSTSDLFPISPFWRWLPRAYRDEIAEVSLTGTQVTDADLAHLRGVPGLQEIYLYDTGLTDTGLAHLKGLASLKELELNHNQVTDVGLAHLQGLTGLQRLGLSGTQITDDGLSHLEGLVTLQELSLGNTLISDAGMPRLETLTGLKGLNLYKTRVTSAGVAQLCKALPNCHIYGR